MHETILQLIIDHNSLKDISILYLSNSQIKKFINNYVDLKTCKICQKKNKAKYLPKWDIVCHQKCLKENLTNIFYVDDNVKAVIDLKKCVPCETYLGYNPYARRDYREYVYDTVWEHDNGIIPSHFTVYGYIKKYCPDIDEKIKEKIQNDILRNEAEQAYKSAKNLLAKIRISVIGKLKRKRAKEINNITIENKHYLFEDLSKIAKTLDQKWWFNTYITNYFTVADETLQTESTQLLMTKLVQDYKLVRKLYSKAFAFAKETSVEVTTDMINRTNYKWDDVINPICKKYRLIYVYDIDETELLNELVIGIHNYWIEKGKRQAKKAIEKAQIQLGIIKPPPLKFQETCVCCKNQLAKKLCQYNYCGSCCTGCRVHKFRKK